MTRAWTTIKSRWVIRVTSINVKALRSWTASQEEEKLRTSLNRCVPLPVWSVDRNDENRTGSLSGLSNPVFLYLAKINGNTK